jgi:hypothetical protein
MHTFVLHCFAFTLPARLPRDMPEKSEGFPMGALCCKLGAAIFCSDLCLAGRALTRKALGLFRHITRRINLVGASFNY